ncbi:hypothetical protein KL948_001854 [Ogataea haglerorum]|uniref:DNA polymerase epsilon subunit D n=1 Tax=Ogataea haglerorum TaxID=1937702 RepID=A0ABQ7RJP6_9ASCO|nr:hypothetical protein KL915_002000 [Ogataea haglerorum]KAG7708504.1 hypothetical protein KL914_002230 [Ogataea haglerorum]KAG7710468.1 hypothetical protein KL950_001381 [Ogataea haglerorum]KAG7732424.1 hypothetical protein KL948_001854 [Ogataea haglerorum]KAG7767172.1 hypothetical protein KL946_001271 [Ogataea haglerorum]
MPAKGWKKDGDDSNFETAADNEKVSIESMLFPKATVHKVAKQVLSQSETNMILAKESQTVLQRGSVLFVNYVYHHAKQVAKEQGRKVVNANDVLAGLERAQFGGFVPALSEELEKFHLRKEYKKKKKDEINEPDDEHKNESKRAKLDVDEAMAEDVPETTQDDAAAEATELGEDTEEAEEDAEDDGAPALTASQHLQQEMKELEGDEPTETAESENEG